MKVSKELEKCLGRLEKIDTSDFNLKAQAEMNQAEMSLRNLIRLFVRIEDEERSNSRKN